MASQSDKPMRKKHRYFRLFLEGLAGKAPRRQQTNGKRIIPAVLEG
jgi:hypothetical protein